MLCPNSLWARSRKAPSGRRQSENDAQAIEAHHLALPPSYQAGFGPWAARTSDQLTRIARTAFVLAIFMK